MSEDFLTKIRDRILVKEASESLKQRIMDANTIDGSQKQSIKSADGKLRLTWQYKPYRLIDDTDIHQRQIECAIFRGQEKVVAADFLEFKVSGSYGNKAFFQHMDDEAQYLGEIALAYVSGWDAEDLDDGNLAVLDNLAASGAVPSREWTPLLQKFIETHVLKTSFVMIAKPFPHDAVEVINAGRDTDEMQALARNRHDARIKFSERIGMTKYEDEARTSEWTYRMSDAPKFDGLILHPEFRNFEIRDLHKPMRHDF